MNAHILFTVTWFILSLQQKKHSVHEVFIKEYVSVKSDHFLKRFFFRTKMMTNVIKILIKYIIHTNLS
jgi:hypothetical protein